MIEKKIEWIRLNKRHGDITDCASAHQIDGEYLYHVTAGRRTNEAMLDKVIEYIVSKAPSRNQKLYEVEGLELPNNSIPA